MFGRFNEVDDKPDWREKLAEWRASPLWVPKRPEWLGEGPGVLAMLFVGIASLMAAVAYAAIPPQSLPAGTPGYFDVAKANASVTTTSTTSTTTTTIPAATRANDFITIKSWSAARQQQFWAWVQYVNKSQKNDAAVQEILAQPPTPPTRRWDFALIAGVVAALLLWAAWYMSDTRSRNIMRH